MVYAVGTPGKVSQVCIAYTIRESYMHYRALVSHMQTPFHTEFIWVWEIFHLPLEYASWHKLIVVIEDS